MPPATALAYGSPLPIDRACYNDHSSSTWTEVLTIAELLLQGAVAQCIFHADGEGSMDLKEEMKAECLRVSSKTKPPASLRWKPMRRGPAAGQGGNIHAGRSRKASLQHNFPARSRQPLESLHVIDAGWK